MESAQLPGPVREGAQREIGHQIECATAHCSVATPGVEPTGIARRFDELIVQKEPAWPVYPKQFFVIWRCPCPTGDADVETAPKVIAKMPTSNVRAKTI
jgi:hypothetical protein